MVIAQELTDIIPVVTSFPSSLPLKRGCSWSGFRSLVKMEVACACNGEHKGLW